MTGYTPEAAVELALEWHRVAVELALEQLGVAERVLPGLVSTLDQIRAYTSACLADERHTYTDWKAWTLEQREEFMVGWRRRHGRKHPNTWPPRRAEWESP